MNNTSIKLTLEQRKLILELLNYSYIIPPEYQKCVAKAIKDNATTALSDRAIHRMVTKSQNVASSGFLLRENSIDLFRGKFAEWLACIEYNAFKNSSSVVMIIINPDPTSKADLLHFIMVGDEFRAVKGPDIKTGGSTYVFNQWKKIVLSRHDIPMVDFDGVLTTEEGLKQLTKTQREEFDRLSEQYPRKKPLPSLFSKQDELRLRIDYFKSVLDVEESFQYTPEVATLLRTALAGQCEKKLPQSDWLEFNRNCKEIFRDFDASKPNISNLNAHVSNKQSTVSTPLQDTFHTNPSIGSSTISKGGTHASPVLHPVKGYTRRSGTSVSPICGEFRNRMQGTNDLLVIIMISCC